MYHYTMCGLDNVWLANGYTIRQTPYGEGVSITAAENLHEMLALQLANKDGSLTPKELRFLRVEMKLSQESLGKLLGVTENTVSLWERGRQKLPKMADMMVRLLYLRKGDDALIKKAIDRVNTVERIIKQRIVVTSNRNHRWTPKVETVAAPEEALPA
jgi:DNA-binding transcriptional regulator YiaG